MTNVENWLGFNDEYIANAVAWLRQRLQSLAGSGAPPAAVAGAARLPAVLLAAEQSERPPALTLLARRLRLNDFERLTLLLCVATELDTGIAGLCARAQGDPNKAFPTFSLAFLLFDAPSWDALAPERPLRHFRLLEVNTTLGHSLVTHALRADERIVNYIKGLNHFDERLAPLVTLVSSRGLTLPPSQLALACSMVESLEQASSSGLPIFELTGADTKSKLLIAEEVSKRLGLVLHRISPEAVPTQAAEYEAFARLWQRERLLLPIALYVDSKDTERAAPHLTNLRRLLARGAGVVFLDTRDPWQDLGRESVCLEVVRPTPDEQRACWSAALGASHDTDGARLAGQFNFDAATIHAIADATRAHERPEGRLEAGALWSECLRRARPALDQLAQPLEPKARWEDLELPAAEKALLRQIADQVRVRRSVYDEWGFRKRMNRGLGISVLFAGESGTGKTMAAEVIANELGLWLHRIDLSAVVSKYIGETEKNLRRLFDAAEDGGSILFFDEADALFGKRSEVKDSHDRYANIEINYLLQRMEAYRGLAILATNMRAALDSAFVRRLRFIVNFAFPTQDERGAIWRHAFPPETPTQGIDFARLSRFNLTGGSIHNIALNAAFLAASARRPVTMPFVLEAARNELKKLDKPINEADFRCLASMETGT